MSTQKFIEERKYLKCVSEKTLNWYRDSFKAFAGALETEEQVKRRIVETGRPKPPCLESIRKVLTARTRRFVVSLVG